jgi:Arc/MetJ-type ribon-helix-helix transcriptional regulator
MANQHPTTAPTQPMMVRVPSPLANEIRQLAARESESQSTVLRRLLRLGLDRARRAGSPWEAADYARPATGLADKAKAKG